jgi:hypothetical protein
MPSDPDRNSYIRTGGEARENDLICRIFRAASAWQKRSPQAGPTALLHPAADRRKCGAVRWLSGAARQSGCACNLDGTLN